VLLRFINVSCNLQVYYNELETRVRLSKRRQKAGQQPNNTRLIVRHRPLNANEFRMQRYREKQLEPPGDDDEDEEEEEEETQQEVEKINAKGLFCIDSLLLCKYLKIFLQKIYPQVPKQETARKNHALRHAHLHEPLVENHALVQNRAQGQNQDQDQNHAHILHQNPDLNPDHARGHDLDHVHDHVRYPGHDLDLVARIQKILLDLDQNHRRDRVREALPSHCRDLDHLQDPSQDHDLDQDLLLVVVAVQPVVQVKVVQRVIKWNRNMFDDLNVSLLVMMLMSKYVMIYNNFNIVTSC
jgi:hypothetical protein